MITTIHTTFLKRSRAEKLKPKFYGSYRVSRKVGKVAYELEMLGG
jgi:hypothetical protein